jgi:hypothetical protein
LVAYVAMGWDSDWSVAFGDEIGFSLGKELGNELPTVELEQKEWAP